MSSLVGLEFTKFVKYVTLLRDLEKIIQKLCYHGFWILFKAFMVSNTTIVFTDSDRQIHLSYLW